MSELWPVKKLGEICDVSRGKTITRKQTVEGDVPVVAGGISSSYSHNTANRPANVITVSGSGANAGFVNFWQIPIFASDCSTILPLDLDKLDVRFVYYAMLNLQNYISTELRRGAAQPHVYAKDIALLEIPFPPLEQQQRIVSVLDEAFRNINCSKHKVELKTESGSELLQSIVESVFSETGDEWMDTTLGDISEIIMGQSPKGDSYNSEGIGVPLINGPVEFGPDPFSKTLKTKFTTAPTKMCEVNDLILCVRGSTTGRMNIAGHESCIGRGVAAIRSNEYQDWINHFINFNRNHIFSLGTGATFPNISKDSITKIRIPIPPDNERKLLVFKLQNISFEIDLLNSKITQELNSLEELKQSILQKAFEGKMAGGIIT